MSAGNISFVTAMQLRRNVKLDSQEFKNWYGTNWQDSTNATECEECHSKFSFVRRKHHCRKCGKVFCDKWIMRSTKGIRKRACVSCNRTITELNERVINVCRASVANMKAFKHLLDQVVDINFNCKDGFSCLYYACMSGHSDMIKALLRRGVDHSIVNPDGLTCLQMACVYRRREVAELLLQNGADFRANDMNRNICLAHSCQHGMASVVSLLLSKGADLKTFDKDGTLWQDACARRDWFLLSVLADNGAMFSVRQSDGRTFLHCICEEGRPYIAKKCVEKGVDVEAKDHAGKTCLHVACEKGTTAMVELCISSGANVEAKDNLGRTPLVLACLKNHSNVGRLLLSRPNVDVNTVCSKGFTPLMAVCAFRHIPFRMDSERIKCEQLALVEALLDSGADVNYQSNCGRTAIIQACQARQLSVIELLINRGADITIGEELQGDPMRLLRDKDKTAVRAMLDRAAQGTAFLK